MEGKDIELPKSGREVSIQIMQSTRRKDTALDVEFGVADKGGSVRVRNMLEYRLQKEFDNASFKFRESNTDSMWYVRFAGTYYKVEEIIEISRRVLEQMDITFEYMYGTQSYEKEILEGIDVSNLEE